MPGLGLGGRSPEFFNGWLHPVVERMPSLCGKNVPMQLSHGRRKYGPEMGLCSMPAYLVNVPPLRMHQALRQVGAVSKE